ncbi:hypothetical protein AUP68_11355 [Ilyonectria robusta]
MTGRLTRRAIVSRSIRFAKDASIRPYHGDSFADIERHVLNTSYWAIGDHATVDLSHQVVPATEGDDKKVAGIIASIYGTALYYRDSMTIKLLTITRSSLAIA